MYTYYTNQIDFVWRFGRGRASPWPSAHQVCVPVQQTTLYLSLLIIHVCEWKSKLYLGHILCSHSFFLLLLLYLNRWGTAAAFDAGSAQHLVLNSCLFAFHTFFYLLMALHMSCMCRVTTNDVYQKNNSSYSRLNGQHVGYYMGGVDGMT